MSDARPYTKAPLGFSDITWDRVCATVAALDTARAERDALAATAEPTKAHGIVTASGERLDFEQIAASVRRRKADEAREKWDRETRMGPDDEPPAATAEPSANQCDGCRAGKPVVNGIHYMGVPGSAYPNPMACQASKYVAPDARRAELLEFGEKVRDAIAFAVERHASITGDDVRNIDLAALLEAK